MSDPLDHSDNNRQTTHGYRYSVHEEGMVTCLDGQHGVSLREWQTHTPVGHNPSPRGKVGIDEVAGKEVEEVDKETGKLDVSITG